MKKVLSRKGFTLIELLAVILILGVISLIAIPTIGKIIDDAKAQSYIRSAEGLLQSVDNESNISILKGENVIKAYNFKNNKLLNGNLNLNGALPDKGKVRVSDDGKIAFAVVYDNYCLVKAFEKENIQSAKLDENGCNLPGNNSVIKNYTYYDSDTASYISLDQAYYGLKYRDKIISISYIYSDTIPENALEWWDVSSNQDNSIKSYILPNGEYYDVYVISKNNITYSLTGNLNYRLMFVHFTSLQTINFNNFDTSSIFNFDKMFKNCANLTSLELTSFETPNSISMAYMFDGAENLTSLNIASFDTSNVTNMTSIFKDCTNLTELNLNNFDTSNVTNMRRMFAGTQKLTTLDISNFDTSKVTDMSEMFKNASNLKTIYVGNKWVDASNTTDMFDRCGTSTLTLAN